MPFSNHIRREINDFCSPYNTRKIAFVNQQGYFEFFYFNMKETEKINTKRNEYMKELGYDYSVGDRGRTNYSLRATQQFTVDSDWLSEEESYFLRQLLALSTNVYIYIEGVAHPIIITNKGWERQYDIDGEEFKVTLEYEMAYDINTIKE